MRPPITNFILKNLPTVSTIYWTLRVAKQTIQGISLLKYKYTKQPLNNTELCGDLYGEALANKSHRPNCNAMYLTAPTRVQQFKYMNELSTKTIHAYNVML